MVGNAEVRRHAVFLYDLFKCAHIKRALLKRLGIATATQLRTLLKICQDVLNKQIELRLPKHKYKIRTYARALYDILENIDDYLTQNKEQLLSLFEQIYPIIKYCIYPLYPDLKLPGKRHRGRHGGTDENVEEEEEDDDDDYAEMEADDGTASTDNEEYDYTIQNPTYEYPDQTDSNAVATLNEGQSTHQVEDEHNCVEDEYDYDYAADSTANAAEHAISAIDTQANGGEFIADNATTPNRVKETEVPVEYE